MRTRPILRLATFLLVLVAVDRLAGLALERLARGVVVSGGSPGFFDAALATPRCDTLVLGSSQALHGIDPEAVSAITGRGCANLGCHGQGIYCYLTVLGLIEAERLTPRTVVVCCTYDDLFTDRAERVLRFGTLPRGSPEVMATLTSRDALLPLKWASASYPFNAVNPLALLMERWRPDPARRATGFVPLPQTMRSTTPADFPTVGPLRNGKLALYGILLDRLRALGIRVLLVALPSHHPGIVVDEEEEAARRWQALAAEHGAAFLQLSAARHPEFLDMSLFMDTYHLNCRGAMAASRLLAERLAAQ